MEKPLSIVKDPENELPVPIAWRKIFEQIVGSFVEGDYFLTSGVEGVSDVSASTASQIENYVHDYGEELIQLPHEAWESSVYIWMGTHWDVLVDLWTVGEGRSDMVLSAHVFESGHRFAVTIDMVYVP